MTLGKGIARAVVGLLLLAAIPALAADHAVPPAPDANLMEPPTQGQVLDVGVGLHIINIASISEVLEQFEIDGYLLGKWIDPRLQYTPSGPGDGERMYRRDQIWVPFFEIVNAVAPRERYDTMVRVSPDGTAFYVERFHVVLSSKFALKRFPFDSQSLLILIHPFVRQLEKLKFSLLNHHIWRQQEFNQFSSLAQWDFEAIDPSAGTAQLFDGTPITEARFAISVKRRSNFYVWKVILPLLLMVFLSWSVFWIEARDLSNQVQIAVTTILTVIAFAFAISATMPRVPYLTYIDAFFLECYVFVFLAIVELMIVHLTHRRERATDLGKRIQGICRWLVPLSFAASNAILIIHFLS